MFKANKEISAITAAVMLVCALTGCGASSGSGNVTAAANGSSDSKFKAASDIGVFLFANGVPAIFKISAGEFLGGKTWKPMQNTFGFFSMIIGSLV